MPKATAVWLVHNYLNKSEFEFAWVKGIVDGMLQKDKI